MRQKKYQEWYCYVCGELLGNIFYLYSMQQRTDRVFLFCTEQSCKRQAEREDVFIEKVVLRSS